MAKMRKTAKQDGAGGREQNDSASGGELPLYCDYSCPHADFSDPSAVGACRRDIGVWCGKAGRFHNKHARCLFHD